MPKSRCIKMQTRNGSKPNLNVYAVKSDSINNTEYKKIKFDKSVNSNYSTTLSSPRIRNSRQTSPRRIRKTWLLPTLTYRPASQEILHDSRRHLRSWTCVEPRRRSDVDSFGSGVACEALIVSPLEPGCIGSLRSRQSP